jgi:signal peptidase I
MRRTARRLAAAALAVLAVLSVSFTAAVITHRIALVSTYGISMNPVYYQGDLVVVQRESSYRTGEIVAYHRPDKHLVVLHRIIGGDASGFTFKGDNNQSIDPTTPRQSQLVGRAVLHIPHGGLWLRRFTGPPALAAYTLLLLLGGSAATRTRRQRRKDRRTMSPRHRAPCTKLGGLPRALCPVALGSAAVGLIGLTLAGVAWTRPAEHLVAAQSSTAASMRFAYTTHVPRTPAYDGLIVTAPQPVFRKLANSVDVTYWYRGLPGTLTTTAELSTASGWTTSIPISKERVGKTYDGTVHLDLAALQRRADSAAKATGLPAGEVSLAIVPRVSAAAGGTFAPRFRLTLTDLVLKPTGDLTTKGSMKTKSAQLAPVQLTALGHSITVTTGRRAGAAALLLFLLTAIALAAIARLTGPVAEADRVRARYGQLILPVLPVALAAGRPVVDVPDVDTLARLAERYGLLVLQWSRGGIDTYVVQDENTTFRYRAGEPAERTEDEPLAPSTEMTSL